MRCFSTLIRKETNFEKQQIESINDLSKKNAFKINKEIYTCPSNNILPNNAPQTSQINTHFIPFDFDHEIKKHNMIVNPNVVCGDLKSLVKNYQRKISLDTEVVDDEFMTGVKMKLIPENDKKLSDFFDFNDDFFAHSQNKFLLKQKYLQDCVFNKYQSKN